MKRLFLMLVVATMLVPAIPTRAASLKIATSLPEGSSWMRAMRAGAGEIKDRTQGRVTMKFYGGGVMGNDKSVLRKIRVGQLHGGAFTAGGLSSVYSDLKLYSLPFLFRNLDEVLAAREKLDPIIRKGLFDKGFVCFGFAGGGFANLMSNKVVRGISDVKGRKIWVPEGDLVSYAVMEAMSLSPVTLNLIDVMTGLQTGLLDIVAATPTAALAFQWHTRIKYVADMPLVYVVGTMAIDRRAYKTISIEDQAVIEEIMGRIYKEFDEKGVTDDIAAIKALKSQGIEFIAVDSADMKQWRNTALSVERELARDGIYSEHLFELLVECVNDCSSDWSKTE